MTDPEFIRFFDGDWAKRLAAVEIPGMPHASWDRKAAWLLWTAERKAPPPPSKPGLFD
ncbi:MAG: hypothetical protein Unbinned2301contig1004_55 [Prokaryotic dsDNA virus sp.]|nr:MAG: hypothetical protein Unbinned2301contig1004_55 [Prokaryotic dsDNA virus sp.]|tara:strand:- start:5292 stop:5465 length:174 start_codon:yes stop_codon:yes gene_type:complete